MRLQGLRRNIGCRKYISYHIKNDFKQYCIAHDQEKCATREFIKKFDMDIAGGIKEQPKSFWNNAKSKSRNKVSVSDHNTLEGMIASTDLGKTDVLNSYFSRISTKLDNTNIPSVDPIENVPQMMDIIVT